MTERGVFTGPKSSKWAVCGPRRKTILTSLALKLNCHYLLNHMKKLSYVHLLANTANISSSRP